jgi:hypothetical protein
MQAAGLSDLVSAIERGELTAHAAAVELGWIKRPPSSGGSPNVVRRRQLVVQRLAHAGAFKQHPRGSDPGADCPINLALVNELWLGPSNGTFFNSREELKQTWELARAWMLRVFGRSGRRPAAWWEFDSPVPYPGHDRETAVLYEANLLDAEERDQLEHGWRREFEHALEPGFSVTVNPEVILIGARARRAHWEWAGIPSALIEQWQSERRRPRRRRRRRTVEVELEAASASDSA